MAESTRTRSRQYDDSGQTRSVAAPALILAVAGVVLALSCAEIAPPPGGEVDRTAPTLLSVTPPNGAVGVPISDRVILQFSERVLAPRTGKAFYISPHLPAEPRVNWRGDRIEIIFPDSFATNQTYIISISSAISDLRNNVYDSAGTIAFSTGPVLDSGRVAGTVYSGGAPQAGFLAGLYEAALFTDTTVWDSLFPTYLTQTNQQGQFSFAYLPDREYRLLIFQDRNGNERFNPARESFAVGDRPIVVGAVSPLTGLRLATTTEDTTSASVVSASFTPDRLVRIRLSRPIPLTVLRTAPEAISMRRLSDTTVRLEATAILEEGEEPTSTLTAWFGLPDSGIYRMEIRYDADRPALMYDSLLVSYSEDRTSPQVVRFDPPAGARFLRDIEVQLTFSEPLDTTNLAGETFVLWREPDSVRLPLQWSWKDPFRLVFDKSELVEGQGYRLAVTEFDLKDWAGNVVGDSLREYRFSTLDVDSLGSITGEVTIELTGRKDDLVELTFRPVGRGETFTWRGKQGPFTLDIPAGDYLLSGYVDSDANGVLSLGSADPYRLSETQVIYGDTIQVRARFETAGVDIVIR